MASNVPKPHQPRSVRIVPAELAFDANGTPYSRAYGDVYHSAESGPGQAQHVFLAGNDLPRRWAAQRVFTIAETGFGFGLNFLMTWKAWRSDPARCERLHFVSIEKHPFTLDALRRLHERYSDLAPLAAQLHEAWPALMPGLHRLHFGGGRVTLTLALGDAAALLPRLRLRADAIYLDGFAPDRNDDIWSPRVMKGLARLSHPGTTLATWSIAAAVRERLAAVGFALEKRPGFGRKREMLCGRFAPRWPVRARARNVAVRASGAPANADRHAIVIGAGLAGAAAYERLSARGWRIDQIESEAAPVVPDASSFAGIFHPHVSSDDCILSRAVRSGYLYGVERWRDLERAGHRLEWSRCGVLQLDDKLRQHALQASAQEESAGEHVSAGAAAVDYPGEYAEWVTRDRAQAIAGVRLRSGGWWFPGGGWLRPASLIAAQLAFPHPPPFSRGEKGDDAALTLHYDTTVDRILRAGSAWRALSADGRVIASAPVLILANSHDITRLVPLSQPLARVRGQITYVPSDALKAPRTVVTGAGHVLPEIDGLVITGSTYDRGDDRTPQVRGHEANLLRLATLLPEASLTLDPSELDGAVGFRAVAPDRLPLVGAVPDVDAVRSRKDELAGAHLDDLPRIEGLYCISGLASRGLIWSALAGEIIASLLEGEPLPLESDLADAIDPARFVLRQLRSGDL